MILYSAHGREWEVERCLVMGILNATPDSFSDGGDLDEPDRRRARIKDLLAAGVDIFDIGGESTRPGFEEVGVDQEIARVLPVIRDIRASSDAWISIDTSKEPVAAAALDAGADFVNDVSGLGDQAMGRLVSNRGCSIVLMRHADCHGDIVEATRNQLQAHAVRARAAGISDGQIIIDPGLGFGERPGAHVDDNMALIDACGRLGRHPVLIGASRKRFVGTLAGIQDPKGRDPVSVELAVRARDAGADILRVHDVAGTVAALQ